jgi:signal transduction histidine kinase
MDGGGIMREETLFFSTKGKGKGVGLDLAVAYGIIQRHQGKIEVQSREG